ncbi:hypothetical protein BDA96_03G180900 [Sorghum bicolor]|uniref:Uncharacterized protein n=1 Tax=Sorghum bicolor TaxID=4558 RepID=A0A921RDK7_SORBI|nr:hypothetical protein BDA96_03G180900 [Sorghum bicolor]
MTSGCIRCYRLVMPPSSSGSGHLSFKEAAGFDFPGGREYYKKRLIIDYQKA